MQVTLPTLEQLDFVRDIAPGDWMKPKDRDAEWYYRRGYSALQILAGVCQRARLEPESILDFGCGHGSVARMLKALYPNAKLVGQDVNAEWLKWCSDTLGIETALSASPISSVQLESGQYDLIWAGSVFSHLPQDDAVHLLTQFKKALSSGGIAVISTAGKKQRGPYVPGKLSFVSVEDAANMLKIFDEGGYGFAPYNVGAYEQWGHSLIPPDWKS
jgi:2-polyprenyl-3-methyl-5-hydroxy-6-metoxy-1,4-benzoquinol methylase